LEDSIETVKPPLQVVGEPYGLGRRRAEVVFDLSLVSPLSQEFTRSLLGRYGRLTFIATPRMLQLLKEIVKYRGILRVWDIDIRYVELIMKFITTSHLIEKIKPINIESLSGYKIFDIFKDLICENITELHPFANFIADEMCLALEGYPILCTSCSEWKIVEFFDKIGVKIKRRIPSSVIEKGIILRTKSFRLMALAMGVKAAFVYVLKGPLEAFQDFGADIIADMIALVIVDG